ncbi:MAG: sterol desaturase family protein [Rhodobacterales bacterium]|nr:sterol desaturase family protein [Rhodobacterales bacterium]
MKDTDFGSRDKRGHWTPNKKPQRAPIFVWPAQPKKFLKWLPGYVWPWNFSYFTVALVSWLFLTPDLARMQTFQIDWILLILLRNVGWTLLFYGGFHLILYIRRHQETNFKYNARWPDSDNPDFLFGSQNAENIFWTFCSGVPVWTAIECVTWWLYANNYLPFLEFAAHPVWFVIALLLVPAWRELHFYLIHRLIHVGPLYHLIHRVHHKNVNPGPWSGMSMSTLEHLFYFSGVLIHFIVPLHPLHAMFQLMHAGLSPAKSHVGFDRIVTSDDSAINTDNFYHYLHHKYFEVNYGERRIPLDEWFGTAHDGSAEADEAMYRRIRAKKLVR